MSNMEENLQSCNANATNSNTDTDEQLKLHLQNAINRTAKAFLSNLKYSLFKSYYPEIHQNDSTNLKELHRQLKSQLTETIHEEVEELCKEVDLYASISSLDKLIQNHEGKDDVEAWRPSGNPSEDMRDHLYQMKLKHKRCLEFTLQTMALQNKELEKMVEERHTDILAIKDRIDLLSAEIRNRYKDDGSIGVLQKQIASIAET
ncbi:hypothetical protein JTE90_028337 [Oedothorax gibbosus]|uniref:Polyamine-modulated factor 1 n=1 Tax=Oedothorax gibbosus TaxID=931172 RepID=A0AAV6V2A6_9ARAC|nr:hypothetical protein JTE90_028337 [Oedothorax gibbosus]